MRRSINIREELEAVHTIEDLTEVFESIASLHIGRIRDRVVTSKTFFAELWRTYRGLRVDPSKRLVRKHAKKGSVFVAITSQSKLSGEINERVIANLLDELKQAPQSEVVLIGSQGGKQIEAAGKKITAKFALPTGDYDFNVNQMLEFLNAYDKISVFYQTYESLRVQKIARIDLISAVRSLGEDVGEGETVSSLDYIFEPTLTEIADYMESIMMGVALIQIIMESKLAQYASRFNTMNAAKKRAYDLTNEFKLQYYRSKRSESDERIKEMLMAKKAAL